MIVRNLQSRCFIPDESLVSRSWDLYPSRPRQMHIPLLQHHKLILLCHTEPLKLFETLPTFLPQTHRVQTHSELNHSPALPLLACIHPQALPPHLKPPDLHELPRLSQLHSLSHRAVNADLSRPQSNYRPLPASLHWQLLLAGLGCFLSHSCSFTHTDMVVDQYDPFELV